MNRLRLVATALALSGAVSASAWAQDPHGEHHHDTASASWTWAADANVFVGYNDQRRPFADVSAWESQNWFMGSGSRPVAGGRFTIDAMCSLEPFTLHDHGSPQLFQTGESFNRQPLLNYQHPHDLVMGLGATYDRATNAGHYYAGADVVGSPTLGPIPFMHRASARSNPQVPITHHYLDATHISTGVVRGGVTFGPLTLESSVFRGASPDEDRLDIERPRLDSWAGRVQFNAGPWHAQFSGGRLHEPEWFDPLDVTLVTASVGFDGVIAARPLNVTLAWGGHREHNGFNGDADGYLAEGELGITTRGTFYGRAEYAGKDLFVDVHPKGFTHRTVIYQVGAFTAGYLHDVSGTRAGRFGIGADATLYDMQRDLRIYWESSRSFHVFLRWRPTGSPPHRHM
jgi:hypothetical protein